MREIMFVKADNCYWRKNVRLLAREIEILEQELEQEENANQWEQEHQDNVNLENDPDEHFSDVEEVTLDAEEDSGFVWIGNDFVPENDGWYLTYLFLFS
jgi:hypothetical protein